jgi:hypothetical protein
VTSMAAFWPTCAAVSNAKNRRWCAGAGYLLYDRATVEGQPYAATSTAILTVKPYADGLAAAGLTAAFQAIDAP